MSASLVGSEMCIRDRVLHCAPVPTCDTACWQRLSRRRTSEPAITCLNPVSYTHLTLPTICSV
eukprot:8844229-Alexandrium_andersonii.AAC.1